MTKNRLTMFLVGVGGLVATILWSTPGRQPSTDLEVVREVLKVVRTSGHQIKFALPAKLRLEGYRFHWELSIAPDVHVILVSRTRGGALLAFREDGSLAGLVETAEITSAGLFDFDDEDGPAEVITEQIEGGGTGVLLKRYHIYRIGKNGPQEVWKEDSLDFDASYNRTVRGAIRMEEGGFGLPYSRLLYLKETVDHGRVSYEHKAFAFREGRFVEVEWSKGY